MCLLDDAADRGRSINLTTGEFPLAGVLLFRTGSEVVIARSFVYPAPGTVSSNEFGVAHLARLGLLEDAPSCFIELLLCNGLTTSGGVVSSPSASYYRVVLDPHVSGSRVGMDQREEIRWREMMPLFESTVSLVVGLHMEFPRVE